MHTKQLPKANHMCIKADLCQRDHKGRKNVRNGKLHKVHNEKMLFQQDSCRQEEGQRKLKSREDIGFHPRQEPGTDFY